MDQIGPNDRRIKTVTMALGDFMKEKGKIIDMNIIPTSAGLHRIHRWWKHAEVLMFTIVDYIAQIHAYVKYPEGDFDIKEAHATALRVIRMEEMINIGYIRTSACFHHRWMWCRPAEVGMTLMSMILLFAFMKSPRAIVTVLILLSFDLIWSMKWNRLSLVLANSLQLVMLCTLF